DSSTLSQLRRVSRGDLRRRPGCRREPEARCDSQTDRAPRSDADAATRIGRRLRDPLRTFTGSLMIAVIALSGDGKLALRLFVRVDDVAGEERKIAAEDTVGGTAIRGMR